MFVAAFCISDHAVSQEMNEVAINSQLSSQIELSDGDCRIIGFKDSFSKNPRLYKPGELSLFNDPELTNALKFPQDAILYDTKRKRYRILLSKNGQTKEVDLKRTHVDAQGENCPSNLSKVGQSRCRPTVKFGQRGSNPDSCVSN